MKLLNVQYVVVYVMCVTVVLASTCVNKTERYVMFLFAEAIERDRKVYVSSNHSRPTKHLSHKKDSTKKSNDSCFVHEE